MTLHILPDLKPEDILYEETINTIVEAIKYNIGRTMAFAITGYGDHIMYTCMRYIEDGGIDDLIIDYLIRN